MCVDSLLLLPQVGEELLGEAGKNWPRPAAAALDPARESLGEPLGPGCQTHQHQQEKYHYAQQGQRTLPVALPTWIQCCGRPRCRQPPV